MQPDYQIAALWMEGRLSYLEQLCLKSFVDAGHHVKLYHYGPLENVPSGVELADANEVLPRTDFLAHARTGSPALHSDLFRYRLLEKNDRTIWADTDAYCMKRFETETGHFHGWESEKHINGGVLGLPQDSTALGLLLEFTRDEFAIPPWSENGYKQELNAARDAGHPIHVSDQPWGVWGPHAVTHFLMKTGEARHSLPQEGLYPFTFKERRKMLRPNLDTAPWITENTFSIHLYGRRMRKRLVEADGGYPPENSLLWRLLRKHDIDPAAAPLPTLAPEPAPPKPEPTTARKSPAVSVTSVPKIARREPVNLTDLADKFGSDKGSTKHNYTRLYHMLFAPFRHRPIKFLEMGLLIGGPEHGRDADRPTADLPSIRMWLEYFDNAEIHGLDVSDFTWFEDDRFTFHRCDMGDPAALDKTAEAMPEFDIILDDASHASHHQQNAFVTLFPRLKSGGLYIIEDLRWQPPSLEIDGITKTAELFQGYLEHGSFKHSDPKIAKDLNALAGSLSGVFVMQAQFRKKNRDQIAVIHKR